jgi:hypothetical protein
MQDRSSERRYGGRSLSEHSEISFGIFLLVCVASCTLPSALHHDVAADLIIREHRNQQVLRFLLKLDVARDQNV